MPQAQPITSVMNNFSGGLKTEYTGLNFPENACTDTENCVFSIIGDTLRREGIDYEAFNTTNTVNRTGLALSTYRWTNVGGDGLTQILVTQIGPTLYFYRSSSATVTSPLSTTLLVNTINISSFLASGSSNVPDAIECQYTDGNGYLFVFHPYCDPFYCSYNNGTVLASVINVQIRDFSGALEPGVSVTTRPASLTDVHNYNLQNQGWTSASAFSTSSTTRPTLTDLGASGINGNLYTIPTGVQTFTVSGSSLSITPGTSVSVVGSFTTYWYDGTQYHPGVNNFTLNGVVNSYIGTTLTINVLTVIGGTFSSNVNNGASTVLINNILWNVVSVNTSQISTWFTAVGNYPSNSDVWWTFKDTTDVFNPATTISQVTLDSAPAPSGYYILSAFNQNRAGISGIASLSPVSTTIRPRTGTWFQGRVWYSGVDASQIPSTTGDQGFYTWSENIYFSQIVQNDPSAFGMCYQTDDPTSESLFDLLPTDGGVIQIQGCGAVYKLFPINNGVLVFAANGVWMITGSQGIGFTANDYTVAKISAVQSISGSSFVNVLGLPMFWNEEGIYAVEAGKENVPYGHGGLQVNPLTVGTILSYYNNIPLDSKKYVRGDYNPLDYTIQWTFRSTQESSVTDRYQFDTILNLNIYNKAFYPYVLSGTPFIHGVNYIASPGGSTAPDPVFKYLTSAAGSGTYTFTFSEERDPDYVDWFSFDGTGVNYTSYFVTGYSLKGQGIRKFQAGYVYMFVRNDIANAYKIQGIWDYAISPNSNKYSTVQTIINGLGNTNFDKVVRRHRIRGHGLVLQIKVTSVDGLPFDVMGWSLYETASASV